MAINAPQISYLRGYDAPDIAGNFGKGFGLTKGIMDEQRAAELLSQYADNVIGGGQPQTLSDLGASVQGGQQPAAPRELPSLSQFGLTATPDVLRGMLANPQTRDMAMTQIREATARRAEALDPMRQLQLKKAQIDLQQAQRGPGPSEYDKRFAIGRQQGLTPEELKVFTLTGKLPDGSSSGYDPGKAFDYEKDLYSQYRTGEPVKTYSDVRNSYERVRTSAAADTPQGDLGLVYGFMKMLDPTSVVREGEFATAEQTAGLPQTVVNIYNKLLSGERLGVDQRQQFAKMAGDLYKETASNLGAYNDQFTPRLQQWRVDPARVLLAPETYADPAATTPAAPSVPGAGPTVDQLLEKYR